MQSQIRCVDVAGIPQTDTLCKMNHLARSPRMFRNHICCIVLALPMAQLLVLLLGEASHVACTTEASLLPLPDFRPSAASRLQSASQAWYHYVVFCSSHEVACK